MKVILKLSDAINTDIQTLTFNCAYVQLIERLEQLKNIYQIWEVVIDDIIYVKYLLCSHQFEKWLLKYESPRAKKGDLITIDKANEFELELFNYC